MSSSLPPDLGRALQAAFAQHQRGDFTVAELAYRQVLAAQPDQPDANHLLGVLLDQTGRGEEAAELIRRAIAAAPDNADAHCNLGRVLEGQGQVEEAVACYEAALIQRPGFGQARFNLGVALRKSGRLQEAIDCYRALVAQAPDNAPAHFNLGNALKEARQAQDAIQSYRHALERDPAMVLAWVNLGNALADVGELSGAAEALLKALGLEPQNSNACLSFATLLRGRALPPGMPTESARAALLSCLERDELEHQDLVVAATGVLLDEANRSAVRVWLDADSAPSERLAATRTRPLSAFLSDPLFLMLIERGILMDPLLEEFLTGLRAALLLAAVDPRLRTADLEHHVGWLAPLAAQCYRTEYVYRTTPAEEQAVGRLQEAIVDAIDNGAIVIDARIALLACYRSLHHLANSDSIAGLSGPPWWQDLARIQILEPARERVLAQEMPRLQGGDRRVSEAVRRQYEENPYPRWLSIHHGRAATFPKALARDVDAELLVGAPDLVAPRVLVAGCGTGLHAISCALEYEGAAVLAVDLSRSSLAYGKRRAEELGVGNIDFLQADLLDLGELGRRFDVIESVGVLHHLADPAAGWRVLVDLLRPGGYMKIGLYSETARKHVVAAREFAGSRGFEPSLEGIRDCRRAILELGEDQLARKVVASGDYYSASGFRDLVFHVHEHRLTLGEIAGLIDDLGLEFLGFAIDDAHRRAYRAANPTDTRATSLSAWARYESAHPDTFGEMYQFWLRAPREDS